MLKNFQIPKTKEELLKLYSTPILHLRQQYRTKRIGLTIGAGVSRPLNYPSWSEFVKMISSHRDFKRNLFDALPDSATVTTTQRLFEYYQSCVEKEESESERVYSERVLNKWKRLLSECLYAKNIGSKKAENIASHPYFQEMIPVILQSNLVVNFNFDDSVQTILEIERLKRPEWNIKKYETRWNLNAPIRNDLPTIFHLNGYLAYRKHDYNSENLVFAEDSFLKRTTHGRMGDDTILLSEYINNTYLHVGLSLNDEVLKALLQKSLHSAPANIHYQIHFVREQFLDTDVKNSIANANFSVLNLFTMFLGDEGTKSLFELISMNSEEFMELTNKHSISTKRTYYVTGCVGTGKTSTVNHFKNFWAIDEWLDPSPEVVSKQFDELTPDEVIEADTWVGEQFTKKNLRLKNSLEHVAIVDRCPIDPLTFADDRKIRAQSLKKQYFPGSQNSSLESGAIFVLEAMPYEIKIRLVRKWKFWKEDAIEKLLLATRKLYKGGPVIVDTIGLSQDEVVRSICRKIFFEPYKPLNLSAVLDQISQDS
jgi:SIR2-like domain